MQYWEANFKEAISTFNLLSPSQQQNDNLRFLYSNALMSLNRVNEASAILSEIIQNNKSLYAGEARYYLALCYLKNGNNIEARKNLQTYIDNPKSMQKVKARKIAEVLDMELTN
jgi:tetratricopeptide (TPR) repeat protein